MFVSVKNTKNTKIFLCKVNVDKNILIVYNINGTVYCSTLSVIIYLNENEVFIKQPKGCRCKAAKIYFKVLVAVRNL